MGILCSAVEAVEGVEAVATGVTEAADAAEEMTAVQKEAAEVLKGLDKIDPEGNWH